MISPSLPTLPVQRSIARFRIGSSKFRGFSVSYRSNVPIVAASPKTVYPTLNLKSFYSNYASEPLDSSKLSKFPRSENEVYEILKQTQNEEERQKIFKTLMGAQKPLDIFPNPQGTASATASSGVHTLAIGRKKTATDYVGIPVHQSPFESLVHTYKTTLKVIDQMPKGAVYRQAIESLTLKRLEIISKYNNKSVADGPEQVETKIKEAEVELGVNLIEEAIHQAEDEYSLTLKFLEAQPWQDLEEQPASGQWEYFTVPCSTSYPKD